MVFPLLTLMLLLTGCNCINPSQVIVSSYNLRDFDKLYSYFSETLKSKLSA